MQKGVQTMTVYCQISVDELEEFLFNFRESCEVNAWDIKKADIVIDETGIYFKVNNLKLYIRHE